MLRHLRHVVLMLIGATLLVSHLSTPARAASAPTGVGATCDPTGSTPRWQVSTAKQGSRVTHLRTYVIGPDTTRTLGKRVPAVGRAAARVRFDDGPRVGRATFKRVIRLADRRLNILLVPRRGETTSAAVSERIEVSNSSERRRRYVVFKGRATGKGRFARTVCRRAPSGAHQWVRQAGTWRSYGFVSSGGVQCGAGSENLGRVATKALRRGCAR